MINKMHFGKSMRHSAKYIANTLGYQWSYGSLYTYDVYVLFPPDITDEDADAFEDLVIEQYMKSQEFLKRTSVN